MDKNGRNYLLRYALYYIPSLFALLVIVYCLDTAESYKPIQAGTLLQKSAFFKNNPDIEKYNVIYFGDSRCYTNIHPDRLDPILGSNSINLSCYAHWFPTQYPFLAEHLPVIPKKSVVVWSIGFQNFMPINDQINNTYPISFSNLPSYLDFGYSFNSARNNLFYYNPLLHIFSDAPSSIRYKIGVILEESFWTYPRNVSRSSYKYSVAENRLISEWKTNPDVASVSPNIYSGKLRSLSIITKKGSHNLLEIDHAYYRNNQKEFESAVAKLFNPDKKIQPDTAYWNIFTGIVELFKKNKSKIIVNIMDEAPFIYDSLYKGDVGRMRVKVFMTDIKEHLRQQGIPCISIDWSQLKNEHFFDYNHLNSEGISIYTNLFAQEIKPYLSK